MPGDREGASARRRCAGSVTTEQQQADGGHADADPLAGADLEAEQPLGQHREHHDAGGEHGLDDGQRRERERGDVQDPGAGGDAMPIANQLEPNRARAAAQRVAHVDRGRRVAPRCL